MLKDITIGQYFPGNSLLHRLDPRMKIILTCLYMAALFTAQNVYGLALAGIFMVFVTLLSRVSLKVVAKGLKPILLIILITCVANVFLTPGKPIFKFYFLAPTYPGAFLALFMSVRIIFLIVGASMLTYTTSPIVLTDGLERLMSPLKIFRLPVHELSMMMTIALRFIPTLIEETDKIMNAQKARGADFESGSVMKRLKSLVPVLVPLFISAFRRAGDLALAMECRCYRGGEGRTRLRQLKLAPRDFLSLFSLALLLGCIITLNIFFRSQLS